VDKVNAIDDLIALMHAHDDDCPILKTQQLNNN
jgi:hypothetical protein